MAKKKTSKLPRTSTGATKAVRSDVAPQVIAPQPTPPSDSNGLDVPVVGIGASAGGLAAFKKFFSSLPADSGMAFVLVPHLDPTHESLMVELLARQTSMPVCEATEGMPIEPNRVYIIPPNKYLAIVAGRLQLSTPAERHGAQTAIDFFFRSLAAAQHERAIGIILSGTSSHGTVGLKEIKLVGGMVMVQQPESADYDQMPRSAIATGLVDFVLPPEKMPAALVKYVRHPYVVGTLDAAVEDTAREQLGRVLAVLKARTKYDFGSYRKNMLLRRVQRRMGLCHTEQLADYLDYLRENPDEVTALYQDLLIGVTGFFREPEAFQVLQQRVIPDLVKRSVGATSSTLEQAGLAEPAPRRTLRLWSPACATGEEAYTLAMLFIEQFTAAKQPLDLQIFATDIDERSLEVARLGTYSENSTAEISPERLQRFFVKTDPHHWQVNKRLRESITFASQNLLSDAPFSRLDLISCRNLLIYLEPAVQAKIIRLFHFALSEGGYLLLGPSESIGRDVDLFEPVSKKWRVFRRIGPSRRDLVEMPIVASESRRLPRIAHAEATQVPALGFKEIMQRLILDDYAPASVLISRKHEIHCVLGPLVNYLEFPPGEISKDLLALARPGLRTKIRAAVHRAVQTGDVVRDLEARVKRNGAYVACSITVKPISEPNDAAGLLLVTFADRDSSQHSKPTSHGSSASRGLSEDDQESELVQHLEQEVKSSREELQSAIEEYESSSEELKASNEEVMSMNEELQSANEELETSKEELQSMNEELSTVNSQLQEKVAELDRSNSDLTNLITSTDVATVFLDSELRIKRFTPPTAKLLNLLASDIDRPFSDFAPKFSDDALLGDCRLVLDKLTPIEKEVWTVGGRQCYLRRILPYRTASNRIEGVVITFLDITARIAAEAQSRRLATVLWDSNDAVTLQDFDGRITAWNRGAERMYGYTEDEALQMNIRDTVPDDKRSEALAYMELLNRDETLPRFETRRRTKDGRVLDVALAATVWRDEFGRPMGVATTERDITDQKNAAAQLKKLNESLEQRVAEKTQEVQLLAEAMANLGEGVMITKNHLNWPGPEIVYVNQALCRITGYTAEELIGQTPRILQGEETDRSTIERLRQELSHKRSHLCEVVNHRKDGTPYDAELFITSLFDAQGTHTNFIAIHRDISQRKRAEALVREKEERMRAILNTAADAIITIDRQGTIDSVNPATERMFGYPGKELVGQNIKILMPSPYRDEHDGYLARYLETGQRRIIGIGRELTGLRKDGTTFPLGLSVSEVDHLGLFTGIIRDISDHRALQKQVLEIAAQEDRRIGHELHDNIQQQLTGLGLLAQSQAKALAQQSSQQADIAARLAKGIRDAANQVHLLSRGLVPVEVDSEGLRSALADFALTVSQQYGVHCELQCENSVSLLDNFSATHLYRIAQEAVSNAIKHGGAKRIELALKEHDGDITLEVRDNGTGIGDRHGSGPGMGLRIMGYRAGLIGATLHVTPRNEGGTLVDCVVRGGGG